MLITLHYFWATIRTLLPLRMKDGRNENVLYYSKSNDKIYLEFTSLMQLCIKRVMGILAANAGEIQVQPSSSIICCQNFCTISANYKKDIFHEFVICSAISKVCVCLTQYCFQNKQLIMFLLCSQCYLWWDLPISSQLSTRDSIPLWSKWLSPLWPH